MTEKKMKNCFWCGQDAERYLPGMYVYRYGKYLCENCDRWDFWERCAGRPGLQKPTKNGARQLTLMFPIVPRKEAVVLTGNEFLKHMEKLLDKAPPF
jgi:hypothetical protein